MKYKLTIETPGDVISIQCNNIESVKRFADCVAGFILPEGKQDEDGWIEWGGGDCPVTCGTIVDVRCRGGSVIEKQQAWGYKRPLMADVNQSSNAGAAYWRHDDAFNDIVAYRLHKSEEQNQ